LQSRQNLKMHESSPTAQFKNK